MYSANLFLLILFIWLNLAAVHCYNSSSLVIRRNRVRLPLNTTNSISPISPSRKENITIISAISAPVEEDDEASVFKVIIANVTSNSSDTGETVNITSSVQNLSTDHRIANISSSIPSNSSVTSNQADQQQRINIGQWRTRFPLLPVKRPPFPASRLQPHSTQRPSPPVFIRRKNTTLINIVKRQLSPAAWISSLEDFTIDVPGYL